MVLDQDQTYNLAQKEKKKKEFEKKKELMRFQKVQAGELYTSDQDDDGSLSRMKAVSVNTKMTVGGRKSKLVGGPMQIEEIRMNKGLLKKIARMKREQNTVIQREDSQEL